MAILWISKEVSQESDRWTQYSYQFEVGWLNIHTKQVVTLIIFFFETHQEKLVQPVIPALYY